MTCKESDIYWPEDPLQYQTIRQDQQETSHWELPETKTNNSVSINIKAQKVMFNLQNSKKYNIYKTWSTVIEIIRPVVPKH